MSHTAGPFISPPFPNFQVYPIGVVPKKHSSDWRTIFHLSYPKHHSTSVNAHISPTDYSLHYISVDNAISIIQSLGQGCFMSKLDIKSAFRNIPVHPSNWELLGMKWQGLYYFDTVLPFGLRSAPYLFDQFSCMLEWIIKTKLGIPNVIHILDDFSFVTKPPRSDCLTALCNILCLFTELDIPVAPGKTFPPTTSLGFMGVLFDSIIMEARLPLDKLTRTKEALHEWSHKKSATLKELQSLIGTLQFACRVVVPGRAFLQRIISLTKGGFLTLDGTSNFIQNSARTFPYGWPFLDTGMRLTFSWGPLFSPPQISSYLPTPLVLSVMVVTLMVNGFKATGSHHTPLTLLLGSALTGRNFSPFILLAFSGVPTGLVNVFVSGVTTHRLSP